MSGGAIPTSANTHASASGTTRSAVADGTITVRNGQAQTQNVSDLSRDTDNANGHIDKIFDKDKVANKLEFDQGMQELGQRVAGDVSSYQMQAAENETKERLLKANPEYASLSKSALSNLIVNDAGYKAVAEKWGTGGSYSMAAAAVTGVLGGLGASNLGAAAAGGMAPYIANKIKHATSTFVNGQEQTNVLANTMAHAVAGAVLAQLAGNSATAGAAGAAGGELMARAILRTMYPGKQASDLTQEEKQVVSALGQLAAQLSAGVASGSVEGGIQGAVAGKNAVENNALSAPDEKKRQDAKWSLPYLEGEKKQQAKELVSDLDAKDKAFDAALDAACKRLSSAACKGMRQELASMGKSYSEQLDGQYIGNMGSIYKTGKGQVDALIWQYATADAKAERDANVNRIAENWGVSKQTANLLYTSMAGVHTVAAIGGAVYGLKGAEDSLTTKPVGNPSAFDTNLANVDRLSPPAASDRVFNLGTKIDNSLALTSKEKLPDNIISTFKAGDYETAITKEPITLYRKFGGSESQAKLDGGYATTTENLGRDETAVYKKWSTTQFEAQIEVPKNTKLNIGFVGEQPPLSKNPKYYGGADQILLPRNYSSDWIKTIRDGKTGKVYTYDEFKKAFPEQVSRGK